MHESDLLRHIRALSADLAGLSGPFGEIVVGPGDDCAVLRDSGGSLVLLTVDQLVAGRHFDEATDIDLIARKAIARSVSDIAAMGGLPCWGLATALLPHHYPHADTLFDAMARWAKHWNCPLIGGDIATGPGPLSLTVTVAGRMEGGAQPILRSGARPGDTLWLTGPVGSSDQRGRHLTFEPRIDAGKAAADSGVVHAMIDISDGLGRDAARIGAASNVRLELDLAAIPFRDDARDWRKAVSDGEDYELIIVATASQTPPFIEPAILGPVGRVRLCRPGEAPGATFTDGQGETDAADLGWDHV